VPEVVSVDLEVDRPEDLETLEEALEADLLEAVVLLVEEVLHGAEEDFR